MNDQPAAGRRPVVVIGDGQSWSARSLATILAPHGYEVVDVYTALGVKAAVTARRPDAIVIQDTLPDADAIDLVRALRAEPRVPAETPIILAAAGPAARSLRVAALRAGASDVWGLPLDADEVVLRFEAQLRAQFAAARAREQSLVDWATGLYNPLGLVHRARELTSHAIRRRASLACIVLAPNLDGAQTDPAAVAAAVDALAKVLRAAARSSDAVGRLGDREFAILAPDTDAHGAAQLGTRLAALARRVGTVPGTGGPLELRAGYHAVSDVHTSGLGPLDLLTYAMTALPAAASAGPGEWIRSFL
jgi:PleD family two-component response regulator